MKHKRLLTLIVGSGWVAVLAACATSQPAETATPTEKVPPTATSTPPPTRTPLPTATNTLVTTPTKAPTPLVAGPWWDWVVQLPDYLMSPRFG